MNVKNLVSVLQKINQNVKDKISQDELTKVGQLIGQLN